MGFGKRSERLELLDGADIPFADIERNLLELDTINRLLGGHRITVKGTRNLTGGARAVTVCEIGCGGGDNLRAIARWAERNGVAVRLTGIDIRGECIRHAAERWKEAAEARWVCADYREAVLPEKPDIVFSSLFCHHFTDDQLPGMFRWMAENSGRGFFVNDLHRHPLAWIGIRILTGMFSRSRLVRHDAPLSVLRGFSRKELEAAARKAMAGSTDASIGITSEWAFRWLLTVKKTPPHRKD